MASETSDGGRGRAESRSGGPGLRIGLVAAISGLVVLVADEIGRRRSVPALSDCGKCSEFGDFPHFWAENGYPVLAFFAGTAAIALAFAVGRVARRWELLAWLLPLGLFGILSLRYLQDAISPASAHRDSMFPLDGFWTVADALAIAACAAFLAVATEDRIGAGIRRTLSRCVGALTACGLAYWLWVLAVGDPLHH